MNKNFFHDAVTLDPAATLAAWQKLGRSTWPHEIGTLPAILHQSLTNRLKKEKSWPPATKPTRT